MANTTWYSACHSLGGTSYLLLPSGLTDATKSNDNVQMVIQRSRQPSAKVSNNRRADWYKVVKILQVQSAHQPSAGHHSWLQKRNYQEQSSTEMRLLLIFVEYEKPDWASNRWPPAAWELAFSSSDNTQRR